MNQKFIVLGLSLISFNVYTQQSQNMEELQKQLNSQILNQEFHVENDVKLEAELDKALKKGIKPVTTPSIYWRPGYTCANIRPYSWRDYRNCRYHYLYYGRYW